MSFLSGNWFTLVQTVGILAGLMFAAMSFRANRRATQVSNLLQITQFHRDIWKYYWEHRDELARITSNDIDNPEPITAMEEHFVTLQVLHLNAVFLALNAGALPPMEGMNDDVAAVFGKAVPRAVWLKIRHLQNRDFATFVDQTLGVDDVAGD